jgi:hypothetical protein
VDQGPVKGPLSAQYKRRRENRREVSNVLDPPVPRNLKAIIHYETTGEGVEIKPKGY